MIILFIFLWIFSIVCSLHLIYNKLESMDTIGKLYPVTYWSTFIGVIVLSPVIFIGIVCHSMYEYLK